MAGISMMYEDACWDKNCVNYTHKDNLNLAFDIILSRIPFILPILLNIVNYCFEILMQAVPHKKRVRNTLVLDTTKSLKFNPPYLIYDYSAIR